MSQAFDVDLLGSKVGAGHFGCEVPYLSALSASGSPAVQRHRMGITSLIPRADFINQNAEFLV